MAIVLALLASVACAAGDTETAQIRAAAEKEANAVMHNDYATIISLTYPKLVEMSGGPEKMKELLAAAKQQMDVRGIATTSVRMSDPEPPVAANGKIFSVVPTTVVVTTPAVKITRKSFLLAVSGDSGATWTFIDAAGLTPDGIANIVPELPASVKLPEAVPPTKEPK